VTIPAATRIGHVHLRVADLERAISFYSALLGLDVVQRIGHEAAFLSAGGYHHHLGLNTWGVDPDAGQPPAGAPGLYHFALLYPGRAELACAVKVLVEASWPIDGCSDHGVSDAVYLTDPDGNGVELYWDRPMMDWPRSEDGALAMFSRSFTLEELLTSV
jgi:catechol 2,3-dioxygenase